MLFDVDIDPAVVSRMFDHANPAFTRSRYVGVRTPLAGRGRCWPSATDTDQNSFPSPAAAPDSPAHPHRGHPRHGHRGLASHRPTTQSKMTHLHQGCVPPRRAPPGRRRDERDGGGTMVSAAKLYTGQQAYYTDAVARGLDECYAGIPEMPGRWVGRAPNFSASRVNWTPMPSTPSSTAVTRRRGRG